VAAPRAAGGGVGTRGPGESQLETDGHRTQPRLAPPEKAQGAAAPAGRAARNAAAQRPTVALAGYTNVGKSTLLNASPPRRCPCATGS
jgi:GTP-binding protein HflX